MTIEDLKDTAAMAHLAMDEKELAKVYPAFKENLEFFASLKDAEGDRAAFPRGLATASAADLTGVFGNSRTVDSGFYRSAASGEANPPAGDSASGLNETLLNNSGERDGRFVVVPNVL